MDTLDIDSIIKRSTPIFKKHTKIARVDLFGSFAKGTQREDSDLDFLVHVKPNSHFSIMDFVTLQMELEQEFQRSVDVVDRDGLTSPWAKKSILESPNKICIM